MPSAQLCLSFMDVRITANKIKISQKLDISLMLRISCSHQNSYYLNIAVPLALVNMERDKLFNFKGIFRKGTAF